MKFNKRLLSLLIPFLAFSMFSCAKEDNSKKYQITKEQYETQCNRDYVLTEANYTIRETYGYRLRYIYMDHGDVKIESGTNETFYKIEFRDASYSLTSYRYGETYTENLSKQEMYNFFFMGFDFFFDMAYEALQYSTSTKSYVVDANIFDPSYDISNLVIKAYEGYIKNVDVTIANQRIQMEFYDINTTTVTLPEDHTHDRTLTYKYTIENGKDDNYVIEYVKECLRHLYISRYEIDVNDGYLTIKLHGIINDEIDNYIYALLTKPVLAKSAITNAHDEAVVGLDFESYPGPDAIYLGMETDEPYLLDLVNTMIDDMDNDDIDYAIESNSFEDEETIYLYPLFIWANYDEEICTFDNYVLNETDTLSNLYTLFTFDPNNFSIDDIIENHGGGYYYFYFKYGYIDLNGDGLISNEERDYSVNMCQYVAAYLSITNEGLVLI